MSTVVQSELPLLAMMLFIVVTLASTQNIMIIDNLKEQPLEETSKVMYSSTFHIARSNLEKKLYQLLRLSTMEAEKLIEAPEKQTNKQIDKKGGYEMHSVIIPPNRMTPLKNNWEKICETVVKNMKLQIRMNAKKKTVDIRECEETEDRAAIQRTYNFLRAFMLGFSLQDSIAMLRLDDLFLDTFQIKDVKNLQGDHLSRCIARISGEKGKTKNAIENATKTRIILADSTIHLMGSYANMRSARDSLCSLIMGTPAGKVYSQLKYVSRRLNEKF